MRYFLVIAISLLSLFSFGQTENTFFIKKKADADIKKVFTTGDKLSVTFTTGPNQTERVKGEITAIQDEIIQVDDENIQLSQIVNVQFHSASRKLAGVAIAGAGVGIGLSGQKIPESDGFDLSGVSRGITALIGGVTALTSTIFLIIMPKKCAVEKFEFKTFVADVKTVQTGDSGKN